MNSASKPSSIDKAKPSLSGIPPTAEPPLPSTWNVSDETNADDEKGRHSASRHKTKETQARGSRGPSVATPGAYLTGESVQKGGKHRPIATPRIIQNFSIEEPPLPPAWNSPDNGQHNGSAQQHRPRHTEQQHRPTSSSADSFDTHSAGGSNRELGLRQEATNNSNDTRNFAPDIVVATAAVVDSADSREDDLEAYYPTAEVVPPNNSVKVFLGCCALHFPARACSKKAILAYSLVILVVIVVAAAVAGRNRSNSHDVSASAPPTGNSTISPTAPASNSTITPTTGTFFKLRSRFNDDYCLAVKGGDDSNFTPLQMRRCAPTPAQVFRIDWDGRLRSQISAQAQRPSTCVEMDPEFGIFVHSACRDTWTILPTSDQASDLSRVVVRNNGDELCIVADLGGDESTVMNDGTPVTRGECGSGSLRAEFSVVSVEN